MWPQLYYKEIPMNKKTIASFFAATALFMTMCGCVEKQDDYASYNAKPGQSSTISPRKNKTRYYNGKISNNDFYYYADPALWSYVNSPKDTCDLRMITDKDIISCGVSIFLSDENERDQSAELKVLSVVNKEEVISTGPLATADRTFYYYEWTVDEDIHARMYLADYKDRYICAYTESNNYSYVDGKIAELLSSLTMIEKEEEEE